MSVNGKSKRANGSLKTEETKEHASASLVKFLFVLSGFSTLKLISVR